MLLMREPEAIHGDDGRHERQRQREQRDHRGADVHQEHHDDEDDQRRAFDEGREQVVRATAR